MLVEIKLLWRYDIKFSFWFFFLSFFLSFCLSFFLSRQNSVSKVTLPKWLNKGLKRYLLCFPFFQKMMFDIFDQMTFAFQQDFGLYILLGAIVFGFVLSFAVSTLPNRIITILKESTPQSLFKLRLEQTTLPTLGEHLWAKNLKISKPADMQKV